MIFTETEIQGLFVIEPEKFEDVRGYFLRTYCADEFRAHGLDPEISQCSLSFNTHRGTVRGLHYQVSPYEEVKVVRCLRGRIFDTAADVRPDSRTRGRYFSLELSAENGLALYIPKGFAHGFMSLEDDTLILYQMSAPYNQASARTIRWNDPDINIAWPHMDNIIISDKDRDAPLWRDTFGR